MAKMVAVAKKAKSEGKRIKDSTDFQKASDAVEDLLTKILDKK